MPFDHLEDNKAHRTFCHIASTMIPHNLRQQQIALLILGHMQKYNYTHHL
jgi:hypothetical protein